MNINDYLTVGLRLFFWIVMTLAIRQGSMVAFALCLSGFLIIENYLAEINDD